MTNKVLPQLFATAPLIPSFGKNIQARTNSGTPNTKIDASADYFTVVDSSGNIRLLSSVSGTVDFGTVGANGLDAGTQQASTFYYIYVIAKEDGTKALLGSVSATSPTLPSGYTYSGLISVARSDASVHFLKFFQRGSWMFYEAMQNAYSVSGSGGLAETAVSLTSLVPSIAQTIKLHNTSYIGNGSASPQIAWSIVRVTSGVDFYKTNGAMSGSAYTSMPYTLEVPNVNQNVYVLADQATASPNDKNMTVNVAAYSLPIGGY